MTKTLLIIALLSSHAFADSFNDCAGIVDIWEDSGIEQVEECLKTHLKAAKCIKECQNGTKDCGDNEYLQCGEIKE